MGFCQLTTALQTLTPAQMIESVVIDVEVRVVIGRAPIALLGAAIVLTTALAEWREIRRHVALPALVEVIHPEGWTFAIATAAIGDREQG